MIQKALSKDQIDEVISLSKEFRRPAQAESELCPPLSPWKHLVDHNQPNTYVYHVLPFESGLANG